ncbi:MAG: hypothetical protein AAF901_07405, partial [Bacteroidota bacterium]
YNATASFTKFPKLNPDEKMTEEKMKTIRGILDAEGFNGIVLTVLKDYQEETRIQKDGGYYAGGTYSRYYPRYYGGFYRYYYHPTAYATLGNYVPETTTEYTSKTYILETTVYDLTKDKENQLAAVVTSKIENPQKASSTAEEYVKQIAKSLR